jgi:hypothetical protein
MKLTKTTSLETVIEVLLEKYPNQLPTIPLEKEELGILIGRQQVIKYLSDILESIESKRK